MRRRRMVEEVFLDRITVEPGDGAQPPGDGGPGPAFRFQVAGEALDVSAPGLEQAQITLLAPASELAQIQGVSLTGQAGVADLVAAHVQAEMQSVTGVVRVHAPAAAVAGRFETVHRP